MAWTDGADTRCLPDADVIDGANTGYIQMPGPDPGFTNSVLWTAAWFETYINGNGNLAADSRIPTRGDVEAWRLWDPVNDVPSTPSASGCGTSTIGIQLSWTDDIDIPSVDGGWARNQVGVQIWRDLGAGFTLLTTVDYGKETYNDSYASDCSTTATFKLRYVNKTDTTLVGSYTGTVTETYGDGGIA